MKVGIEQVDGKWPSLALAKLAAYHRRQGDSVSLFFPLGQVDVVYASKVFTETPDSPYLPPDVIRGGSGYDLTTELAPEIESLKPDWSLWPWWPHDLGYSTRGCVRHCPFCIVPRKEGHLRIVAEFADLTTGRPTMILNDNNITAAPIEHFRQFCADATKAHVKLDFQQGLDARLLTAEHAAIIAQTPWVTYIHLAFDHVAEEQAVRTAIQTFRKAGISPGRLTFYILIGFDTTPEEDMYRIELLRSLNANPFVMRYDRSDRYQQQLARWVNNKVAFKAIGFDDWKKAKL